MPGLIVGLIDLYESSFEPSYLVAARNFMEVMIDQFWDREDGDFFIQGEITKH